MEQKNKDIKHVYRIVVVVAIVLTLLGILLPGRLLVWQSEDKMNMVEAVPVEYYSPANLAVARNASANLGIYQKLQLIMGKWESNVGKVDSYEKEMEDYEAVALAKEELDILHQKGLYPVTLISSYGNWYSWDAEFCKVVDATFNTYAAYYWEIVFEKYDGTERHHIYMLEDGTIFLIEAWEPDGVDTSMISKISDIEINSYMDEKRIVKQRITEMPLSFEEYFSFTDIETRYLEWLDALQLQVEEQEYHILQAYSSNRYIFSVQPMN